MRVQDVTYRCRNCGKESVFTIVEGDDLIPECRNCRYTPGAPTDNMKLVRRGVVRERDVVSRIYRGTLERLRRTGQVQTVAAISEEEEEEPEEEPEPDPESAETLRRYIERTYGRAERRRGGQS